MAAASIYDFGSLASQIRRQKKYAWNLDKDFPWKTLSPDPLKYFLPLDADNVAFPNASEEQRVVLSQFFGLMVNTIIAEFELVINHLRYHGWEKHLRRHPVGPEMRELGELFFEEEIKHAQAFARFNLSFCERLGLDPETLANLLPATTGSIFLKAVCRNAQAQGQVFWWIVAIVEEVSLELFRMLHPHRDSIDPLFYLLHKRHMEEEARHHNYAFLMLDMGQTEAVSLKHRLRSKTDLMMAQLILSGWTLTELRKIFRVKKLRGEHRFYSLLNSCLGLYDSLSLPRLVEKAFASAPYLSLLMNTRNHPLTQQTAERHHIFTLPFPSPKNTVTFTHAECSRDSSAPSYT